MLAVEAKKMGKSMQQFGLVSRFHVVLLRFVVENQLLTLI